MDMYGYSCGLLNHSLMAPFFFCDFFDVTLATKKLITISFLICHSSDEQVIIKVENLHWSHY